MKDNIILCDNGDDVLFKLAEYLKYNIQDLLDVYITTEVSVCLCIELSTDEHDKNPDIVEKIKGECYAFDRFPDTFSVYSYWVEYKRSITMLKNAYFNYEDLRGDEIYFINRSEHSDIVNLNLGKDQHDELVKPEHKNDNRY